MAANYEKSKGRRESDGGYFALPKKIIEHQNFLCLSPHANKLLIDLAQQYRGQNNGDLCATWSFMQVRGWRSKETLNNSLRELEHYGFLVQTQQGGLNRPSLYAFTWLKINKVAKEVDYKIGDTPSLWKDAKGPFVKPSQKRQVRSAG